MFLDLFWARLMITLYLIQATYFNEINSSYHYLVQLVIRIFQASSRKLAFFDVCCHVCIKEKKLSINITFTYIFQFITREAVEGRSKCVIIRPIWIVVVCWRTDTWTCSAKGFSIRNRTINLMRWLENKGWKQSKSKLHTAMTASK